MSDGQDRLDLGSEQHDGQVEDYKFEPIKGYPMLNWRGKRPFTSTQFYPAQLKEVHGPEVDGWRNKIFWGDNLQVMSHLLKEFRGKIKVVYIDPPFDSKADYKKLVSLKTKSVQNDQSAFEMKQYSDIWNNDDYLQFMYDRIVLIRELLSDDGALYLHCDWHKCHQLRCILDEVFGASNFRNQIVWAYPGREMHIETKFNSKHDVILFYAKSSRTKIDMSAVATPYDKEERLKTLRRKVHTDPDGREWVWETRGQAAGQEAYKRYVDEIISEGKALSDVWSDIQFLRGNDPQRTGYPTQKPEELVARCIKASSRPGDIVFDCFLGSGTTAVAAVNNGRRFIAADINLGAIRTSTKRMIDVGNSSLEKLVWGFEFYNVNNYDLFMNQAEAVDLLMEAMEVQPFEPRGIFDGEKAGRMVKIMPVNRIATKADLGDLVASFDQKVFQRRQDENPRQPVEKILLVCMGHEPDLKAELELQAKPFKIDVEVVDILRDKSQLEFKRDAEAKLAIRDGELVIENFYPMNLLQKLSLQQEQVGEWPELVDSVMVDWNYDGAVLQPTVVDVPGKDELVTGRYKVPADAGTIRVKITDLLSESWEGNIGG